MRQFLQALTIYVWAKIMLTLPSHFFLYKVAPKPVLTPWNCWRNIVSYVIKISVCGFIHYSFLALSFSPWLYMLNDFKYFVYSVEKMRAYFLPITIYWGKSEKLQVVGIGKSGCFEAHEWAMRTRHITQQQKRYVPWKNWTFINLIPSTLEDSSNFSSNLRVLYPKYHSKWSLFLWI